MPRVVHFEIPAEKPDRAAKFYTDVFGWNIKKWGGPTDYWLVETGKQSDPGINGGLMKRDNATVGVTNVIDVPSVDKFSTKVKESGGSLVVPKMPIPGVGYVAYCKDTEGNVFGIFREDASAK